MFNNFRYFYYVGCENVGGCPGDVCTGLVTQYVDGNHPVSS